ncbi:MAG: hypothetical protein GX957_03225 [Clostridiaceae bacterium]|nr:hypothetical protein [Clostridiaceae bacterium]
MVTGLVCLFAEAVCDEKFTWNDLGKDGLRLEKEYGDGFRRYIGVTYNFNYPYMLSIAYY